MRLAFLALSLLSACGDCPGAGDWERTFSVTVVGIRLDEIQLVDVEVRDRNEDVRYACTVRLVPDPENVEERVEACTDDLVATVYVEQQGEWFVVWRAGRTFRGGTVTVRLDDPDGNPVQEWERELFVNWQGGLDQPICGDVSGRVTFNTEGRSVQLP